MITALQSLLFLAQEETFSNRLAIWGGPVLLGGCLILMGRYNIKKQSAQEQKNPEINLLGQSKSFRGLDTAQMGWLWVWGGIFVIGMSFYQLFK